MQTIGIAICEDDENDASELCRIIGQSGVSADIHTYKTSASFLEAFRPGCFQLAFLGVYFGASDEDSVDKGVENAKRILESDNDIWLAFTTSSPDYAIFGYTVRSDRYIMKPLDEQEVISLLHRAAEHFSGVCDDIVVTVNRKGRSIRLKDIRYVEARNKQSAIYLDDETIMTYTTIDDLEKKLKMPAFLRCHRSFIVNMDHIESAGRDFIMQGGGQVYISHTNQWKVRRIFKDYIARKVRINQ